MQPVYFFRIDTTELFSKEIRLLLVVALKVYFVTRTQHRFKQLDRVFGSNQFPVMWDLCCSIESLLRISTETIPDFCF